MDAAPWEKDPIVSQGASPRNPWEVDAAPTTQQLRAGGWRLSSPPEPGLSPEQQARNAHLYAVEAGLEDYSAPIQGPSPQDVQVGSNPGTILPISDDKDGNVQFDSNAGILGSFKRAFQLPGQVYRGEMQMQNQDGSYRPEFMGRALEFASNFSPSSAGSAVTGGVRSVPTRDQLFEEATRNYNAMRDSGVEYASNAVKSMAETLKTKLEQEGFDAEVASGTHKQLSKLASPPPNSVATIQNMQTARKTLNRVANKAQDGEEKSAAIKAILGLDDFIQNASGKDVVAGTPSVAAEALRTGNANYAAAKRSETLAKLDIAAQRQADASNSGMNSGNTARQKIAAALTSEKKLAGFSNDELAMLEKIAAGSKVQNATRYVGNLLGGGGGLGNIATGALGLAGGASIGGPIGAAVGGVALPAVGSLSKVVSNSMTRKAISNADEALRSRSPLFQATTATPITSVPKSKARDALMRAFLSNMTSTQGGGGW